MIRPDILAAIEAETTRAREKHGAVSIHLPFLPTHARLMVLIDEWAEVSGGGILNAGALNMQGVVVTGNQVNLPAGQAGQTLNVPSSFAVSLFNAAADRFINLEISALEADGRGKVVSRPRVVTADQTKALIEQGTELPYQTSSGIGVTAITFRKANLKLEVTPQITPEGAVVLEAGADTTCLWVNIKGHVAQMEGEDTVASHGPEDVWDGRALVAGRSSHRFVATEELLAYQLPRDVLMALVSENATFSALLFSDLGQKLSALSERSSAHELQSLTLSRVDEAFLRPAQVVDAQTDVLSVVRVLHAHDARAVLVRDAEACPPALGIFTHTAVQEAVLSGRPLDATPVREFARFHLLSVKPSDTLGDALALLSMALHAMPVVDLQAFFGHHQADFGAHGRCGSRGGF